MMKVLECLDNWRRGMAETEAEYLPELQPLSAKPIRDIVASNPSILLFPLDLENEDDQIGSQSIYSLNVTGDNVTDIITGNIVGFLGFRNVNLTIHSRFSPDARKDYFLHYLLQKVFLGNVFDFSVSGDDEPIFDFLVYFFPQYLKRALAQGLFRQYKRFSFNDSNVRGVVDIPRHIASNYPFTGRIAYSTRVMSADNPLTQLVRHTIEHLRTTMLGSRLLQLDSETRDCVMEIVNCTPSYSKAARRQVLNDNLRPVNHPYYTAYQPLQRLCIAILRHESLSTGQEDHEVKGLLFDCAWLWEEYLATLLTPFMQHPHNRTKSGGIKAFSADPDPDSDSWSYSWYPDFYNNEVAKPYVIDAKYKHLDNHWSREDLQQLISYIHLLRAEWGALAFPYSDDKPGAQMCNRGQLNGLGGMLYNLAFNIPDKEDFSSFIKYSDFMKRSEEALTSIVRSFS